jgi:hypothetical protein
MGPDTIWIFIPLMGMSIPITAIILKHRQSLERIRVSALDKHDGARSAQQDARIEMLEDRIEVLERIITDNSVNVAAQIEALRDTTSIESLKTSRDKV